MKVKGFTLLEITIIVAVITMMLAILVPNYKKYDRLRNQQEAQKNLYLIFKLEKDYFNQHRKYSASLEELGFKSKKDHYDYKLENVLRESYEALAVGNIDQDPTLDIWIINEKGVLVSKSNDILNQ